MNGIQIDQDQLQKLKNKQIKAMLFFNFPCPKDMQRNSLAIIEKTKNQVKCIGLISFKLWRKTHTREFREEQTYGYEFYDLMFFSKERDVEFSHTKGSWFYDVLIKS